MAIIKKLANSQILKNEDLLFYSDNQVISSELVDSNGCSIELYSFDKNESIKENKVAYQTLVFCLEGDLNISGVSIKNQEGVFVEKDSFLEIEAESKSKLIVYGFKKDLLINVDFGKRISFKDFISYVDLAISSKTFIQNSFLSLSLLALDKNESLKTHSAAGDALVVVLDGKVEIKIDEKPFVLEQGNMIILPANIPHSVLALDKFKMLLTVVK